MCLLIVLFIYFFYLRLLSLFIVCLVVLDFIASWGCEFGVSVCCLLVLCLLSVAVFGCLLGYCIA